MCKINLARNPGTYWNPPPKAGSSKSVPLLRNTSYLLKVPLTSWPFIEHHPPQKLLHILCHFSNPQHTHCRQTQLLFHVPVQLPDHCPSISYQSAFSPDTQIICLYHLSQPFSFSFNYQFLYGFASTDSLLIVVHSPLRPIIHITSTFWYLIPKYPQWQWSLPPLHTWQLFLCPQHLLPPRNKWLLEVNYKPHFLPIAHLI